MRRLAEEIESAARNAEAIRRAARADAEQADRDLGGAWADRRAVEETRALIHRLGELVHDDEDVIDMAPGISAGHDGVLVATDRRLLFIAVRRTLSFPYEQVSSVGVKGKWFGARLAVSTTGGKGVISGIAPGHAAEIADLVRSRIRRRDRGRLARRALRRGWERSRAAQRAAPSTPLPRGPGQASTPRPRARAGTR